MNGSTDREFVDWLRDGPGTGPRDGLQRALEATRRVGQRPGWAIPERWIPMQLTMSRTPSSRPLLLLATVALLVVGLVAAVLIAGSNRRLPEPFGLARNGVVAFERSGDILIADGLTSNPRVLVGGLEVDSRPAFSLQGDRLAFVREASPKGVLLMVAGADGSAARVVAGPLQTFDGGSWSPDGSRILVGFSERGMTKLAVVMADGSGSRTLDTTGPADFASWRRGGRQIAFRGQPGDGTSAALIADADGSNIRRLAIESTGILDFEGLGWSPDGRQLVFTSIEDLGTTINWQIGIADVDPDGVVTGVQRPRFDPDSLGEMVPVWSPDGSQLSFILEKDGMRQIAVAPVNGVGPVRLIGPARGARTGGFGHAWSPDGATLLITFLPMEGVQQFWAVDVESGETTEIQGPTLDIPTWQRLAP